MKIDGACHCGYIRVEGEAGPEKTTVCHCTDCQVGTSCASAVISSHVGRTGSARRCLG
jgi:hypothetical protein